MVVPDEVFLRGGLDKNANLMVELKRVGETQGDFQEKAFGQKNIVSRTYRGYRGIGKNRAAASKEMHSWRETERMIRRSPASINDQIGWQRPEQTRKGKKLHFLRVIPIAGN